MTDLLMIDSGAFSVWTKGAVIDLDKYIAFCCSIPQASYYVNLDVIPGKANQKRTLTKEAVEEACQRGWKNYQRMIQELPRNKVIPVYHQNDDIKWLTKYLNFGVEYIGISPANDNTVKQKINWMASRIGNDMVSPPDLREYLFDKAGKPVVKTHGFAVTSFNLMKLWKWYSVDSASWKLQAAWGSVYIPYRRNDYTNPPLVISVSPKSPLRSKTGPYHYDNLRGDSKKQMDEYLAICGVKLGKVVIAKEKAGYKLKRDEGELWYNKAKGTVIKTEERGVVSSLEDRLKVTSHFIKRANEELDTVEHIYFAGAPMPYPLEYQLGRRLLSYHVLQSESNRYVRTHAKLLEKRHAS